MRPCSAAWRAPASWGSTWPPGATGWGASGWATSSGVGLGPEVGDDAVDDLRPEREPQRLGRERLLRQVERDRVHDAAVGHVALLVGDDLLAHLDLAEEEGGAGQRPRGALAGDAHVLVDLRLRVEGAGEVLDEHGAAVEVEALARGSCARGAGRRRRGARRGRRAPARRCRGSRRSVASTMTKVSAEAERRETSAAGECGLAQARPPPRRHSRPPCASASARSIPVSPK